MTGNMARTIALVLRWWVIYSSGRGPFGVTAPQPGICCCAPLMRVLLIFSLYQPRVSAQLESDQSDDVLRITINADTLCLHELGPVRTMMRNRNSKAMHKRVVHGLVEALVALNSNAAMVSGRLGYAESASTCNS